MTRICRFAPSPTGFLHVGNIRAAIINFLYAKKVGGEFYLRLDDTDSQRTKDEYRDMILTDMDWLGLHYSKLIKQSDRLARYEEAKQYLIDSGRLYECFESQEELNMQRKSQTASGMPPLYNRAALHLTKEQKQALRDQGLTPHYRFLLEEKTVSWHDKIKGQITHEGRHFSDPVLVRDNNVPTYTFCSVVDDLEYGITDIIRGEDHITNTAIQIQIFEALMPKYGGIIPDFAHLALIKASQGKISKREGGFDVKSLRSEGYEAFSLINLLSQIGASGHVEVYKDFEQLIHNFDLSKFSKSATNYDITQLDHINQKLLQLLDFADVKDRLSAINLSHIDEQFFNNIKPNIHFLHEIQTWWDICKNSFHYDHDAQDQAFLREVATLLPGNTKDERCWQTWLEAIKKVSDRKGKSLFMPIRLALTGKEHGPELKVLVNVIDREEILSRLH